MKTILVIVGLALAGALGGWWIFLGADREGIAPTNHLSDLTREDGGLGPIQSRDRVTP